MSEVTQGVMIGVGSTLIAAFIVWAVSGLRRRSRLPENVGQLRRGEYAIFQVLEKQGQCLGGILHVVDTILDVVQKGQINGNIVKAIDKSTLSGKYLEAANEATNDFLHSEATGGEVGK